MRGSGRQLSSFLSRKEGSLQSLLDDRFKGANNRGMYVESPEKSLCVLG